MTITTQTVIDEITAGQGIYLSRAARLMPCYRRSRPVTLSCVLRWITDGVRGPSGKRIHLGAARLSGKWVTTPGAIERFIAAQTPAEYVPGPAPRTPTQRQRAAAAAEKQLEALGI